MTRLPEFLNAEFLEVFEVLEESPPPEKAPPRREDYGEYSENSASETSKVDAG
jgi:hypothetical protein